MRKPSRVRPHRRTVDTTEIVASQFYFGTPPVSGDPQIRFGGTSGFEAATNFSARRLSIHLYDDGSDTGAIITVSLYNVTRSQIALSCSYTLTAVAGWVDVSDVSPNNAFANNFAANENWRIDIDVDWASGTPVTHLCVELEYERYVPYTMSK